MRFAQLIQLWHSSPNSKRLPSGGLFEVCMTEETKPKQKRQMKKLYKMVATGAVIVDGRAVFNGQSAKLSVKQAKEYGAAFEICH